MNDKAQRLYTAIADKRIEVVSFDIFDTLLVRPFWEPTDMFFFLDREASKLLGISDVIHFSACRREAEKRARVKAKNAGREDVTLGEIYAEIENENLFPAECVQKLMDMELDLELRFCYVRKSSVELLNYAIAQGKRVIAISDMYLPTAFVVELLRRNGIVGLERVFVSSDIGLSKHSGHLFEYACKELNVEAAKMVHIGDNPNVDVKIPKRLGIHTFVYYRTIDLMAGKIKGIQCGAAFKRAYNQMRSSQAGFYAMQFLGLRCMLAVAANKVYDNPFRASGTSGKYAGDPELFGTLALGMYCMAQALWLNQFTLETCYDRVLFFSRDGYLPFIAFNKIQQYQPKHTEAAYVRISRKALLPLLLTDDSWILYAGSHLFFNKHSPKSIARIMSSALLDQAEETLSQMTGGKWDKPFSEETDLLRFMKLLREQYVDQEKLRRLENGFRSYFSPLLKGNVLTYDVGYSLRNETVLHILFPESKITACFTHSSNDLSLRRASQARIPLRTFYPFTPFVSWLPRELFLTEPHPSCIGYTERGNCLFSTKSEDNALVAEAQKHAIAFMESFSSIFQEDLLWLPLQYTDACLPFETFLHSPLRSEKAWIQNLNSDNEAGAGIQDTELLQFWRVLRTDYWIAQHHLGSLGRHVVRFLMLSVYDRQDLEKRIKRKLTRN